MNNLNKVILSLFLAMGIANTDLNSMNPVPNGLRGSQTVVRSFVVDGQPTDQEINVRGSARFIEQPINGMDLSSGDEADLEDQNSGAENSGQEQLDEPLMDQQYVPQIVEESGDESDYDRDDVYLSTYGEPSVLKIAGWVASDYAKRVADRTAQLGRDVVKTADTYRATASEVIANGSRQAALAAKRAITNTQEFVIEIKNATPQRMNQVIDFIKRKSGRITAAVISSGALITVFVVDAQTPYIDFGHEIVAALLEIGAIANLIRK